MGHGLQSSDLRCPDQVSPDTFSMLSLKTLVSQLPRKVRYSEGGGYKRKSTPTGHTPGRKRGLRENDFVGSESSTSIPSHNSGAYPGLGVLLVSPPDFILKETKAQKSITLATMQKHAYKGVGPLRHAVPQKIQLPLHNLP